METTNIYSLGGLGINNRSDGGAGIVNEMSGIGNINIPLNNCYQQNNYDGISTAIQHENIQQLYFPPGTINSCTNGIGQIQNNGISPGLNCLSGQQLLAGNPSIYHYLYNKHLNNQLFTPFVSPLQQNGVKIDGFKTGIENQDSFSTFISDPGINNASEDENKSEKLRTAAAAQMIINEMNKNRQNQLIHEGNCAVGNSSTGKSFATVTEGNAQLLQKQLQLGGILQSDNSLSIVGSNSGDNESNINIICTGDSNITNNTSNNGNLNVENNNLTLIQSSNTGEDTNSVSGCVFGQGLSSNSATVSTPFGMIPVIPKLGVQTIQDQIQSQYYNLLLQEQLQQAQKHLQSCHNNNFGIGNDLVSGETNTGGKNNTNTNNIFVTGVNPDTSGQTEGNNGVKTAINGIRMDNNENKERIPVDVNNTLLQQIQQMIMTGGLVIGNHILGGIQSCSQSQQNINQQMQLYSIIQQRQMLQRQHQIKELSLNNNYYNQQIKHGIGNVTGSVSIPINGIQAIPNIQNPLGLQLITNCNKPIGVDLQMLQGFVNGAMNYNVGLNDSGNVKLIGNHLSGLATRNNDDIKCQSTQMYDSEKKKADFYDPAIGDELRAVLGLSASAIRGIKTNKNTQEKIVPGITTENNLSIIGGNDGDHSTSENILDGFHINDIKFGKLKDSNIEFSTKAGAYERKPTVNSSKKSHKKISNRGISKNSSNKLHASNLLSIIENEQLSKIGTCKTGGEHSKNTNENVDITNDKNSSTIRGDRAGSNNHNNSDCFVSQSELNRIEYLQFAAKTIPTLVKDYIPSFSGKFASIPLPSVCENAINGKQYTSNSSSSSISASSMYFNYPQQNDIEASTAAKRTMQGLRSRRNKVVPNNNCCNNIDYSSLNNDKSATKNCDISSNPPTFLSHVLKSIRSMSSRDRSYFINNILGLKMVAKEKLVPWMDMPCDMNKKKAKTGLGPNTRESLRKELKKQGEFFRLASTKDEFLCDTKMINNYNPKQYGCQFNNNNEVSNDSNAFNNICTGLKLGSQKGLLNNCNSISIEDEKSFTLGAGIHGISSTSVSSSTVGASSPARLMPNSLSSVYNFDLSGNRFMNVTNNENELKNNFRARY
ncbi:hypothetical protein FG386_002786 [Cryptosporidium ryanae]|uniref:uncharacterized protein n=1 Tax=Cryptosporidium ryanae TaxID=515981 RepID=UPI00351A3DC7|nr:hypothetical protein FG386_002786 [Cryptosporidium ryanae]